MADNFKEGLKALKGLNRQEGIEEEIKRMGYADYRNSPEVSDLTRALGMSTEVYPNVFRPQTTEEYIAEQFREGPSAPRTYVGTPEVGKYNVDEKITSLTQLRDINNTRGELQSGVKQVLNGVGKGAVLAGTTFLDGTVGTVVGAANMIAQQKLSAFIDNPFREAMSQVEAWSEESLPNFETNRERENRENGEWYKNLGTANWWGNSFIKNLGFTVGAFATGSLVAGALKGSTALIKAITGSAISAINEGKIEGYHSMNDFYDENYATLKNLNDAQLAEAERLYGHDIERYNQVVSDINNNFKESLIELEKYKEKVGNITFGLNVAILLPQNFGMWGKLYARGVNTASRAYNIGRINGKYVPQSYSVRPVLGPITEGLEEVEQKVAATIPSIKYSSDIDNYYKAKMDPESSNEVLDWSKAISMGISEVVGDSNSWEEFAIGALTAGIGMPMFRTPKHEDKWRSPVTIQGGVIGDIREYRKNRKAEKELVDRLNNRIQSPDFLNYYQGLIRHNYYQKEMDNALSTNNPFEYKNSEDSQLISDIGTWYKAGKLNDLKEYIDQATSNLTDEDIQSIIENTTDEYGNGPYSVNGNALPKEEIIKNLKDSKDKWFKGIESYTGTLDKILTGLQGAGTTTPNQDELDELIWLGAKSQLFKGRFEQLSNEVREQFRIAKPGLNIVQDDNLKTIEEILNLDSNGLEVLLSSNKNDRNIKAILDSVDQFSKDLENTSNIDYKKLASDIRDLVNIANTKKAFDDRFSEYLNNITKLKTKIEQDKKEVEDTYNNIFSKEVTQAINKARTFKELDDTISGDIDDNILDKALSEASNNMVRDYTRARNLRNELLDVIKDIDVSLEEKSNLNTFINDRYNNSSSLAELSSPIINPTNSTEEAYNIALQIAQSSISNRGSKVPSISNGNNKPTVISDKTGKDETSTIPVKSVENSTDRLIDTVRNSVDTDFVEDVVVPKIQEVSELVNNNKKNANKEINNLTGLINSLPEANDEKFIDAVDKSIGFLEDKISDASPEVTDEELLNNTENDSENSEFLQIPIWEFYRNDLTEYNVNDLSKGLFTPYTPTIDAVKIMQSKIAYDYINEGNVKPGDIIELARETIDDLKFTVMYHKGTIVGTLPLDTNPRYKGIETVNNKLDKGEKLALTVSKVMLGKFKYDRNTKRVLNQDNVSNLPNDLLLGVMKPEQGLPSLVTNKELDVEPVFDELHADGKVYMLLPNSRGTLSPKMLGVKHLNAEEFDIDKLADKGNKRASDLKDIFYSLTNPTITEDETSEAYDRLGKIIHLKGTHINISYMGDNKVLTLRKGTDRRNIVIGQNDVPNGSIVLGTDGRIKVPEAPSIDKNTIYEAIRDFFYSINPSFRVIASQVNTGNYNQSLISDEILTTYITDAKMIGSWFTTTWYDENGTERQTVNPSGKFNLTGEDNNIKNTVKVDFKGSQYTLYNDKIYNREGSIIDTDNPNYELIYQLLRAKSLYGNMLYSDIMDKGMLLLSDNLALDITLQHFITDKKAINELKSRLGLRPSKIKDMQSSLIKLKEDYNKVLRDDNNIPVIEGNNFKIMEDDGKYHDYKNTIVSQVSRQDIAIRTIATQYFGGTQNIVRPDIMSEMAFNSLIRHLGDLKSRLENNGERLLVGNIVLFHKYEDGTRIAEPVDAISVNSITGMFNIYKFGTSTNTYHAKGNSRDFYRKSGTPSLYETDIIQLSSYKNLFDSSYTSVVNTLGVIPFVYKTDKSEMISNIVKESGINIPYNSDVLIGFEGQYLKIPDVPPTVDPTKVILDPIVKESDITNGDTTYFELNGEVVSAPTKEIGEIAGHKIRLYKEPLSSVELPEGAAPLYNYYHVLENGATFLHIKNVSITDQEASKIIMDRLKGNIDRLKSESAKETKVGLFTQDKTREISESFNLLNSINSNIPGVSTDKIEQSPEDPSIKEASFNSSNPLDMTWDSLDSNTKSFLKAAGVNKDVWENSSVEEREAFLNCL